MFLYRERFQLFTQNAAIQCVIQFQMIKNTPFLFVLLAVISVVTTSALIQLAEMPPYDKSELLQRIVMPSPHQTHTQSLNNTNNQQQAHSQILATVQSTPQIKNNSTQCSQNKPNFLQSLKTLSHGNMSTHLFATGLKSIPPIASATYKLTNDGLYVFAEGQYKSNDISIEIDKLHTSDYNLQSVQTSQNKLILKVKVGQNFLQAKMTVYISDQITGYEQILSNLYISRYDKYDQQTFDVLKILKEIMNLIGWGVVIATILLTFLGNTVVFEKIAVVLQIIYLHAQVSPNYLPLSFTTPISGLNILKNVDIFNQNQNQSKYIQTKNFISNFYPILLLNFGFLVWYLTLYLIRKFAVVCTQPQGILGRLISRIAYRPINFLDQIYRTQFVLTIWLCICQFQQNNLSQIVSLVLSVIIFANCIAWPLGAGVHLWKQYYSCEYHQFIDKFEDVYLFKITDNVLPSPHQRIGFPAVRILRLFAMVLVVSLVQIAQFITVILILINVIEAAYFVRLHISTNSKYRNFKLIETALLILMQITMLATFLSSKQADSSFFFLQGILLLVVSFLLIANSIVWSCWLGYKKFKSLFQQKTVLLEQYKPSP